MSAPFNADNIKEDDVGNGGNITSEEQAETISSDAALQAMQSLQTSSVVNPRQENKYGVISVQLQHASTTDGVDRAQPLEVTTPTIPMPVNNSTSPTTGEVLKMPGENNQTLLAPPSTPISVDTEQANNSRSRSSSPTKTMRRILHMRSNNEDNGDSSSIDLNRTESPTKRGVLSRIGGGIRNSLAAVKSTRGQDSSRSRSTSAVREITVSGGIERGRVDHREGIISAGAQNTAREHVDNHHARSRSSPPRANRSQVPTYAIRSSSIGAPRNRIGDRDIPQTGAQQDHNSSTAQFTRNVNVATVRAGTLNVSQGDMGAGRIAVDSEQSLPFRRFYPQNGNITEQQISVPADNATVNGRYTHASSRQGNQMDRVGMRPYDMNSVQQNNNQTGIEDPFATTSNTRTHQTLQSSYHPTASGRYADQLHYEEMGAGIAQRQATMRVRFAAESSGIMDTTTTGPGSNVGEPSGGPVAESREALTSETAVASLDRSNDRARGNQAAAVVNQEPRMIRSHTTGHLQVENAAAQAGIPPSPSRQGDAAGHRSAMRGGPTASARDLQVQQQPFAGERHSRSSDPLDTRSRLLISLIRSVDDNKMTREEFLANVERLMFAQSNFYERRGSD
ncbi:hypothetical protein K440DRAFT_643305 [Wilcoxina mikolae CBS 423.85]|nr:hypothetical protein K440DRAFT_643305 [Wilcoxina mikolae CBS 423.85]